MVNYEVRKYERLFKCVTGAPEFSSIESNYYFNDKPSLDYLYVQYVVKTRDYQSPWPSSYRADLFPNLYRRSVPVNASSKLISFAGQVGYDPVSKSIPQRLPAQVTLALENLSKCLQMAGAEKADIVQVWHYVVGMSKLSREDKQARNKIYGEWMGNSKPPSTLIGVESLVAPELLYEVEVVAIVSG